VAEVYLIIVGFECVREGEGVVELLEATCFSFEVVWQVVDIGADAVPA
jgi:hypothetical protein